MGSKFLDMNEVSERLGFSPGTMRQMARKGTLPCVRIGWEWRISEQRLEEWLKEQEARHDQR